MRYRPRPVSRVSVTEDRGGMQAQKRAGPPQGPPAATRNRCRACSSMRQKAPVYDVVSWKSSCPPASCPKLGTSHQYYSVETRINVAVRPRARSGDLLVSLSDWFETKKSTPRNGTGD